MELVWFSCTQKHFTRFCGIKYLTNKQFMGEGDISLIHNIWKMRPLNPNQARIPIFVNHHHGGSMRTVLCRCESWSKAWSQWVIIITADCSLGVTAVHTGVWVCWFRDRHRDIRNKGSFKINVLFHSDVMLPASSHSPYPFTWPFQDSMEHAVFFNCPCNVAKLSLVNEKNAGLRLPSWRVSSMFL